MLDKRRAKKAESAPSTDPTNPETEKSQSGDKDKAASKGRYRQREVVDRASGLEKKGMDSVLGSVFG